MWQLVNVLWRLARPTLWNGDVDGNCFTSPFGRNRPVDLNSTGSCVAVGPFASKRLCVGGAFDILLQVKMDPPPQIKELGRILLAAKPLFRSICQRPTEKESNKTNKTCLVGILSFCLLLDRGLLLGMRQWLWELIILALPADNGVACLRAGQEPAQVSV